MIDPGVGFKKIRAITSRTGRSTRARAARRGKDRPADIESVEVVFPRFVTSTGRFRKRPRRQFSVQYTTAIALIDGEVTIDSFTNERRARPTSTPCRTCE